MKEVGETLKNKREELGISIQEISNLTKISVRYLGGIEKGDWSMMPGPFYAKGFIRSYAKALGVDITPLLKELDDGTQLNQIAAAPIPPTTSSPVRANRFGKLFALSLVIILFVAVVATIIHYVSTIEVGDDPNQAGIVDERNPGDEINELEELPEKEQEVVEPDTKGYMDISIQLVDQQQATYIYQVSGTSELRVRVESLQGSCWYEIRSINAQGSVIGTNTIRAGNTDELTHEFSLWLRLGNPESVNLYINDTLIEKEATGSPRNFQFELLTQ